MIVCACNGIEVEQNGTRLVVQTESNQRALLTYDDRSGTVKVEHITCGFCQTIRLKS